MIQVAGEALIDLVMQRSSTAPKFVAHVGGAPLNAAVALGRLDVPVRFACPISCDAFGEMIHEKLRASHVSLAAPKPVDAPSPLAIISLNEAGVPSYQFYREGTADRQINDSFIAQCLAVDCSVVHVGGTCLADPVDFEKWMTLINAAKEKGCLVSLDPNIRPSLIDDVAEFSARMTRMFEAADLIKASDEDCETLFGSSALEELVTGPFAGAQLVVITSGSKGAVGRMANGTIRDVPCAPLATLVDTVGAGDCFQAGLLAQLWHGGYLWSHETLASLTSNAFYDAIAFGHEAAAINCSRHGCNPPWIRELRSL